MFYEYQCKDCGIITEIECKVSEYKAEIQCNCGGVAKRIYNLTGTIYKCNGFYNTDSKGK